MSEYIDNELDEVSCRKIEKHLAGCTACHTCLETLKRTIDICRQMETKPVPELFSLRLKEMIETLS